MLCRPTSTTLLLWLLLSSSQAPAGNPSNGIRVEPENVQIGVFYCGQHIRVNASTPASRDIVVRVTGAEEPLLLKRKGKKYGFLWMNVGDVYYEAMPTLYLLHSSRKLDEIATPETLGRLKLGFEAMRDQYPARSKDADRELFDELLKLKQRDRLFCCEAASVQLHSVGSGGQEAIGEFFLPASAPVGDYTVNVFAFQQGEGELIGTTTVHLQRSSVVSSIATLAADHGFLYGCLAVAAAILAGLVTGFIFGR